MPSSASSRSRATLTFSMTLAATALPSIIFADPTRASMPFSLANGCFLAPEGAPACPFATPGAADRYPSIAAGAPEPDAKQRRKRHEHQECVHREEHVGRNFRRIGFRRRRAGIDL